MQANEDDVFNHEVARRAAARAALHLGIDSMSEEALDVMGDVLLTYLQRIGSVMSKMVESSGRTSAHTNVLDAVRAIDMCTSPAVHQVHVEGQETAVPTGVGWKDLASFLLGPDWMQEKPAQVQPEAGGKVGPSSTTKKNEKGWEAPYLDEIPHYPQASQTCANPHTLDRNAALSLHGTVTTSPQHELHDKELQDMPDEIFTTEWGAVEQQRSKKTKAPDVEHEDAPPTKRVRLQDGKETAVEKRNDDDKKAEKSEGDKRPRTAETREAARPSYVPSFLPPFPSSGPGRAIAVDDNALLPPPVSTTKPTMAAATSKAPPSSAEPLDVRSSLVKMGEQSYWGSGWDAETPTKVPAGRRLPTDADEIAQKQKALQESKVNPLDRPSINRASRIIEGSMDAAS